MMKFISAFAWFLLSPGNNEREPIGHLTVQNTRKSKVFCQENLTEFARTVENKADITLYNMALGKIGTGLGAIALATTLGANPKEAAAEDVSPVVLAAAGQTVKTVEECKQDRRDGKLDRAGFRECKRAAQYGTIDANDRVIAEQRRVLAALQDQLAQYGLRLNEQAQILDEGGRVLAQIVAINGKLILREESEARTVAALGRIKAFLEANS